MVVNILHFKIIKKITSLDKTILTGAQSITVICIIIMPMATKQNLKYFFKYKFVNIFYLKINTLLIYNVGHT